MYKNILLPLDGSTFGEDKIGTAIRLAKIFDASITLLQAVLVTPLSKEDREIEAKELGDRARKYLNQIKSKIEKEGVSARVVVQIGDAASEILAYAERDDVDLIIMPTHGVGGFERFTLGSVSDEVVRRSSKPVLSLGPSSKDFLRGLSILAVDDEPDVLDVIEEVLDMCEVTKATNHEVAVKCLEKGKYDLAILDIMGVDGFDLLRRTITKGIPSLMLTAHALTADALRESVKGGAVFFLPKDKLLDIEGVLADVVRSGGKPIWAKIFERFAPYFRKRLVGSPKDKEDFIKELEQTLNECEKRGS